MVLSKEIIDSLKLIWDYMRLNQELSKSDLIMGLGSFNLDVPVRCSDLLKEGYADKILFAGGLGKMTEGSFAKPEAELYRDIAIQNGINENSIFIENKSGNTGDNFRYSKEIIDKNNLLANKIIVVCGPLSERRVLLAAKAIMNDKEILVTSPEITFEEYLEYLKKNVDKLGDIISVVVGDIQRLVIFHSLGGN